MRRPVNSPYTITGEFGEYYGAAAKFLYHSGVDYAVGVGTNVYAPVSGTITGYTWGQFHGLVVQIWDGQFYHRLMHNSQLKVTPGQRVNEGDVVALSGQSGQGVTGPHVHWDIATEAIPSAFSSFRDPAKWLAGEYKVAVQGGNEVFNTDEEIQEAYLMLRGSPGTPEERKGWLGQPKQRFFQLAKAEADSVRQQLSDVRRALANEQAKPPREVVKEVQVIVDRPVEVIKEVPVLVHDQETKDNVNTILKLVKTIRGMIPNLFKLFNK